MGGGNALCGVWGFVGGGFFWGGGVWIFVGWGFRALWGCRLCGGVLSFEGASEVPWGGVLGLMEVSGGSLGHCGGVWGPGRRLQALWGELGLKVGGGALGFVGGSEALWEGSRVFLGGSGLCVGSGALWEASRGDVRLYGGDVGLGGGSSSTRTPPGPSAPPSRCARSPPGPRALRPPRSLRAAGLEPAVLHHLGQPAADVGRGGGERPSGAFCVGEGVCGGGGGGVKPR